MTLEIPNKSENNEKKELKIQNTKINKNSIKKGKEYIKHLKKQENKSRVQENPDAELYAHLNKLMFEAPQNKEITEGKVNFKLGKIDGYLDINNQELKIGEHIYKIKLPHNAKLVSIKITENKVIVKGKVGWLSGTGEVNKDKLKILLAKLTIKPEDKDFGKIAFNLKE